MAKRHSSASDRVDESIKVCHGGERVCGYLMALVYSARHCVCTILS